MPSDTNTASAPYGLDVLTIDEIEYKLNDAGSSPAQVSSETIHEPDENNKAQPDRITVKDGPDLVTRTITVQRKATTTVAPARGESVTWDHDRSGTASTWLISTDPETTRSTSAFDVFTFDVTLISYQS